MQGPTRNRTSTVVAFQPVAAASHGSHFRNAAVAAIHSPAVDAEIIRFPSRGVGQAKAAAAGVPHSTDSDYRHRMLINLLTSAWLAVLGTAGYFTLNGLVQMP